LRGKETNQNPIDLLGLALDVFHILNRAETQYEAIDKILRSIKGNVDISATAIRLEDNGDYPYYIYDGFSDIHIEMENSLCITDRDSEQLQLACICGRILQQRTKNNLPFFTKGGSFWSNNTDTLLKETTVKELGETRNVCNAEGYLSVALIPLKSSKGIIGLLQLNDEKPNKFTPDLIWFLEGLGESIGISLARLDEESHRKQLEKEREQMLHKYQLRIKELDCLYKISKLQENQDLSTDEILNLTVSLLPRSTQYPEIAVVRLFVEDRVYDSPGYRDPPYRYSALITNYGVVVGKLVIGYLDKRSSEFRGPFLEEEVKLVNLVSETISRMLERQTSGDWKKSMDKYALIMNDEEMRHITNLVLEDMAIGEMDREEYAITDLPEVSSQTLDSYVALRYNLELNRGLIIKLQNLLNGDEPI
jgi:GAF domain-containing protein